MSTKVVDRDVEPPVKATLRLLDQHREWCVFPVRRGEKFPPCFNRNLALASNDRSTIRKWADTYPMCNFGLALARSHLIVLDVDVKPGKHGATTLAELELEHGTLPQTFTVRSPSGGPHIYFSETELVKHRMRVSAFGRDIDSTNYVVLPGGILNTQHRKRYTIIDNSPVAPAPDWFAEYFAPKIGANSAADQVPVVELDTPDIIQQAIYFLRNDARPSIQYQNGEYALLMTAGTLKDLGVSKDKAIELLAEFYNVPGKCDPIWDVGEGSTADRLDVKVENAWLYLTETAPGSLTAEADFSNDTVDRAALDAMRAWWTEHDDAQNYVKIDGERVRIVKGYGS